MAGLIKSMVLSRLDRIDHKLDEQSVQISRIDGRVISLEEWRKHFNERCRAHSRSCPSHDCNPEETA